MQKMSEKEAIEYLLTRYLAVGFILNPPKEECEKHNTIVDMAIQALEEIRQYKAIGTVEDILKGIKQSEEEFNMLMEYRAIGTLDQCSEAVERMKPKKAKKIQIPNTSWSKACIRFECPSCNKYLNYMELSHCGLCGQCVDWSE